MVHPACPRGGVIRRAAAAAAVAVLAGCTGPPATVPATATVVTFGDSVPAGTSCGCTAFPDLYARRITAESIDLARPGLTAAGMRAQLDTPRATDALRRASVVLIMIGANDLAAAFESGRGGPAYASAAASVRRDVSASLSRIRAVRGAGLPVIVLGYWNVVEDGEVGHSDYGADGAAEAALATDQANEALREVAKAAGVIYLSTSAALKGADARDDPTELLTSDGDHPNARGHEAIAQAVYTALPDPLH